MRRGPRVPAPSRAGVGGAWCLLALLGASVSGPATVPRPKLEGAEPAVRRQLEEQLAAAEAACEGPGAEAPDCAAALGEAGRLLLLYELDDAASACFVEAERRAPAEWRWPYSLGHLRQAQGQWALAAASFRRVLELRPELAVARLRLGQNELAQGRVAAAEAELRAALAADAVAAAAHFELGRAAAARRDPGAAVTHFEAALRLQPEADKVYRPLALAQRQLGRLDLARELLARAGERAVRYADPLLESLPGLGRGASVHLVAADRALAAGDAELALAEYRRALDLAPEAPAASRGLGEALARVGQSEAAIAAYRRSLALDPAQPLVQHNLGTLLLERGRLEEAAGAFAAALEISPRFRPALANLAAAHGRAGRFAEAAAALERLLALDPQDAAARRQYELARERLRGADAAGGARAAPPSSPRQEFEAACQRMREGDMPWYGRRPAEELAARLAGFDGPPEEKIRLHAELGIEMLELGRPAEAVAELGRGLAVADALRPGDERRWGMVFYLGLAHLQLAEDQNCVASHADGSCILPLAPQAVHGRPEAARLAGDRFLEVLGHEPRHVTAAWLLNLARMLSGEHPEGVPEGARLPAGALAPEAPPEEMPRWIDRAPELGVAAVDLAGGAVMDDFDGDGHLDLVSSTWDPCDGIKAFRNDGRGGFEPVAEAWGLAEQWGGLNLVQVDYDNDGDLDLLVLRGGWMLRWADTRHSLLRNDLDAPDPAARRFTDVTRAAGLASASFPSQAAAWADYDGDGDLDLYIANEGADYGAPAPSQLWRNNGDGTFTEVAAAAGVTNDRFAKAAAWGDFDDDGRPDLYISNIGPNRLYRNRGDGTFVDVAPELGVTRPEGRSFAAWFFDYDNDGDLDLFVADYGTPLPWIAASYFGLEASGGQPLLYRNDGGRFTEVSRQVGLTRPSLPMGANYGDLDNDGWLDIYLGTGDPNYESLIPNLAYRNLGGRFQEVTFATGLGHLQKGHGVAFGDLDHDGDQDLFHQLGGFFPGDAFGNALFENASPPRSWVTLRLQGVRANRFGVGARVEVVTRRGEERRSIHVLAGGGGSFGGSSLQQEIGLGDAEAIEQIVVRWPGSGAVDRVRDVALNRIYSLREGSGALVPVDVQPFRLGGR